jgi:hypothetical protein
VAATATATQRLSTRRVLSGKRWVRLVVFTLGAVLAFPGYGVCQRITNTSNGTLAANLPLGILTPGSSITPTGSSVQFRLRDNSTTGYHLTAQLTTFTVTPGGGTDPIASGDIGVGITSIALGSAVITPRTDTIATGFGYNPTTSPPVTNGLTPYKGAASGSARLSDLAVSRTILSGPRIATTQGTGSNNNCLTVTMTFGVLPQYFTPGTLNAVITLTIANGP